MLETLVSDLLNQYLGQFIDDLDAKQLGTSVFAGSIKLSNLTLKQSLFDNSPLPFQLKFGRVGRISIKIPFWDMFKSPLIIEIENIFGFIAFKQMEEWNVDTQREAFQQANQDLLAQYELFLKNKFVLEQSKRESSASFSEKLVARIVDNLRVSIKNVYFRFEDSHNVRVNIGDGQTRMEQEKFSIGLTLREFSIFTTDKNYQSVQNRERDNKRLKKNIGDEERLTFKTVKLDGFSVFCNWKDVDSRIDLEKLVQQSQQKDTSYIQEVLDAEYEGKNANSYFLHDLNIVLNLQLNNDVKNPLAPATLAYPQYKAHMTIGSLGQDAELLVPAKISLFQPQVLRFLKTVELIGFFNEFRDGVEAEFLKRKLSPQEKNQYLQAFIAHLKASNELAEDSVKNKKELTERQEAHRATMLAIENKVDHKQVLELRSQGHERVRNEDQRQLELDKVEEMIQAEMTEQIGYGFFLSAAKKSKIERDVREKYQPMIQTIKNKFDSEDDKISDNIQNLLRDLKDEGAEDDEEDLDFSLLPGGYIQIQLSMKIPKLSFSLINEFDQQLLSLDLLHLNFAYDQAKDFRLTYVSLNKFHVQDDWISSHQKIAQWPTILDTVAQDANDKDGDALTVKFEQDKSFKKCPFKVKIASKKSLHAVLNIPLINEVMRTMSIALKNEKLDFNYFAEMALNQINQMRKHAKEYAESVKSGEYVHQNADVEAEIFAPVVLIPQDIFDAKQRYIRVDLGRITVGSDLRVYDKKTDYKVIEDEAQLYDVYSLALKKINLQMVEFVGEDSYNCKIIQDVNLGMTIKNCLDPLHPSQPTFKVDVAAENALCIEIPDIFSLFKRLIELKESLLVHSINKDYNAIAHRQLQDFQARERTEWQARSAQDPQLQLAQPAEDKERAKIKIKHAIKEALQIALADQLDELDANSFFNEGQIVDKVQEKSSLEEVADAKQAGDGTNMQFQLAVPQLRLVVGTQEHKQDPYENKVFINLKETDRFVFEMNELSLITRMEKQSSEICMDMGIQKLEIREEFANQEGEDPGQADKQIQENVRPENEDALYSNLFQKIIFWNEKEVDDCQDCEDQAALQQDPQSAKFDSYQMKAKIEMKRSYNEDAVYGLVEHQNMKVDLLLRQTILMANLETMRRVILALGRLVEITQFDQDNAKKASKLARNEMYQALKSVNIQFKSAGDNQTDARRKMIITQFKNLAAMVKITEPNQVTSFIKNIEKILESDEDLQALAKNTILIQKQRESADDKADVSSTAIIAQATTILAQQDDNKRIVEHQMHTQKNVLFTMNVSSIELWLCDFKRNQAEYSKISQIAQVLQFKFGQELQVEMDQFLKQLLVKKKRQQVGKSSGIVFEETKYETITKVVSQNDMIKLNLHKIQIAQKIFRSWESACDLLLSTGEMSAQTSNMLSPTDIKIEMHMLSKLNLDRQNLMIIDIKPIKLNGDYKDVQLIQTLLQRYQRTIQPSMEVFVDTIEAKINEMREKLKTNLQQAMAESLFDKRRSLDARSSAADQEDDDEAIKRLQKELFDRQFIYAQDPAYVESIDFKKGSEVQMNLPQMFRKDLKGIKITISQIQVTFCDGHIANYLKDDVSDDIPLILLRFNNLDMNIQLSDVDHSFDPLTGMKTARIHNLLQNQVHQDFQISDGGRLPYLDTDMKLSLEATYFNQLTQNFEPFVEPWQVRMAIKQKSKNSMYEVDLTGKDLLNLNVTYGMAASLRNIQAEIDSISRRVEEQMMLDEKLQNEKGDKEKRLKVLQEESERLGSQAVRGSQAFRQSFRTSQSAASQQSQQRNTILSPQDMDHRHLEGEQDDALNKAGSQHYVIINHTGLDIQMMNSIQKMKIQKNRGIGLTKDEVDEFQDNKVIDIICDQIESETTQGILLPQKQQFKVDMEQLFQSKFVKTEHVQTAKDNQKRQATDGDSSMDKLADVQLEDDINMINFKLIGQFQRHGAHGAHEFQMVQIENNGIYGYESLVLHDQDSQGVNGPAKEPMRYTHAQKQNKRQGDEFEDVYQPMDVIMSISSKGTLRTISFESQLVICNNTQFPVTILFTFKHQAQHQGNDFVDVGAGDHVADPLAADLDQIERLSIDLDGYDEFKVPLKWYAMANDKDRQTQINMYLVKKKEGSNFENDENQVDLIFENITRKFRGKASDVLNKDIKSKIVELHSDLYVSVDVQGYACLPERTKDKNPVQFLVQLNPPLVIENKTMCAMQIVEIDFPGTFKEVQKLQSQIPAGMSDSLYQLDIGAANTSDIAFKFSDNDTKPSQGKKHVIFKNMTSLAKYSQWADDQNQIDSSGGDASKTNERIFTEDFERFRDIDLSQGRPPDLTSEIVKFQIQCTKRSQQIQANWAHNQSATKTDNVLRDCIINETKAVQMSIYPKYMIVNKTSHDIWNGEQRIRAKCTDFLRLNDEVSQVQLFVRSFKQSQPIELNQIGMTGVITMDSEQQQEGSQLQFGVNIQSPPNPFSQTVVLTVVPRYLIVNKLDKNIALRQYTRPKKGQDKQQDTGHAIVSSVEDANELDGLLKTEFHFKAPPRGQDPDVENLIQFRILDSKRSNGRPWREGDHDSLWTLPFSVDQLDDFQTQLRDLEGQEIAAVMESKQEENFLWNEPQKKSNYKRVVRVIITSNSNDDDATLLIILENPAHEEFVIKNKTGVTLEFYKYNRARQSILDETPTILEGYSSMPFIWDNRDIIDKQLQVLAPKKKAFASLDQVSKYDPQKKEVRKHNLFRLAVKNSLDPQPRLIQLYSTLKVNQMSTKILTINHRELNPEKKATKRVRNTKAADSDDEESKEQDAHQEYLGIDQNHLIDYEDPENAKGAQGIKFSMSLKGLGISLIDDEPKELLYATLSDFQLKFNLSTSAGEVSKKNNDRMIQTKLDFKLTIGNLQIDNMLDDDMSVVFCPKKLYDELILTERNYQKYKDEPLQREFRAIEPIDKVLKRRDELALQQQQRQEKPEQKVPFILVTVVKNTKSFEQKIGQIVRYDEIHCAMQEFSFQFNTGIVINTAKFMLQTMYLFDQDKDMNYVCRLSNMQFAESRQKKMSEICPFVDSSKGIQIDEAQINVNKLSFGIIMLGGIRSTFDITLDKNKLEDLKVIYESVGSKSSVMYMIGPLLQSFASVSDMPLQFNELIILESFISQEMLIKNVANHYKYQVKSQVFRILGSSNLLGNPAGLLDKVGHGVFQMARDPLVGMTQGPTSFVKGVGTGMQGLVKGVIGGSFNSIGNFSGSMYSVIKTSTGQADTRSTQKVTGIVSGVSQGVKGIGSEVASGVSGIFTKPAEGFKRGGFGGLIKGFGKGVVGAVATPVTGVLRAGESISQGISGTANQFSNVGKSVIELLDPKTVRVRESRRIDLKGRIGSYDENMAIVNFYLQRLRRGELANQQIRMFETLPDPAADGTMYRDRVNLLVVTTDYLLVLKPLNFQNSKQRAKLDQSIILMEKLRNLYEYKVMMSPEFYLDNNKQGQKGRTKIQAGFFLVAVATEDPVNASHSQQMQAVDLATSAQDDIQINHMSPQDVQYKEEVDQNIKLGDSFVSRDSNAGAQVFSVHNNTEVRVIENLSLTKITAKLHKNFDAKGFYREIADFGYLKVGKVNGQNLVKDSLLVQMFKQADISHTSTLVTNELGGDNEQTDQIQIQMQNPQQLYSKLHKLYTHPKRRSVIYSDRFEVFDRAFQIIDKAIIKAKENAQVLNQLRREINEERRAGQR